MAVLHGFVISAPSLTARDVLVRLTEEFTGLRPVMKSDSVSAQRAHYAPEEIKVIINTPGNHMHNVLGPHYVVRAFTVPDRVEAANRAAGIMRDAGFHPIIHTHPEPEFPDGFLAFVTAPELEGIVVMFRPTDEDAQQTIMAMNDEERSALPKRTPWEASLPPETH